MKIKIILFSFVVLLLETFVTRCKSSMVTVNYVSDGEIVSVPTKITPELLKPNFVGWYLLDVIQDDKLNADNEDSLKVNFNAAILKSDEYHAIRKYAAKIEFEKGIILIPGHQKEFESKTRYETIYTYDYREENLILQLKKVIN